MSNKKSEISPVVWILFGVLVLIVVIVLMGRAGIISNKTFDWITQKLFPF